MTKPTMTVSEYLEHLAAGGDVVVVTPSTPLRRKKRQPPDYVAMLVQQIREAGLPEPIQELQFAAGRRWRADLAFIEHGVLVEVEGGIGGPVAGRHTRPGSFERDAEKYNEVAVIGFTLVRASPAMVRNGDALKAIIRALGTVAARQAFVQALVPVDVSPGVWAPSGGASAAVLNQRLPTPVTDFGRVVCEARRQAGITLGTVGTFTGQSPYQVRLIETGHLPVPPPAIVRRWASLLGLDPAATEQLATGGRHGHRSQD